MPLHVQGVNLIRGHV